MGYKRLEHLSDAYIEVHGRRKDECFESAALSLLDLIYDTRKVNYKITVKFTINGNDQYNLLYKWLDAVLQNFSINELALGKFSVNLNGDTLNAIGYGEPYDHGKHGYRTEVKGITYYLMEITHKGGWWSIRYLADL